MMTLQTLLQGMVETATDYQITGLSLDSRALETGAAFVALAGTNHVEQALARGASAVIYDANNHAISEWFMTHSNPVPFIPIPELTKQLGIIAARFHGQPSHKLAVIGITGTNGKTSCSQFLAQLLEDCGIIGTLGWGAWGNLTYTGYTTPDAVMTQAILAKLVEQGQQTVAMEVSSHGLAEGRVNGVLFKGVVLTNISRDHLDFHGSMESYIATKQQLFTRTEPTFAVINLNDPVSEAFINVVPQQVAIWGFRVIQDNTNNVSPMACQHYVTAQDVRHQADGLAFAIHWQNDVRQLHVPLFGGFNVDNLLAVTTVMLALGHTLDDIVIKLQRIQPVNGRMQRFGNPNTALIFVDYAHTPDALEKALSSAREHCQQKLWVVFGCGGDRDAGKRSQMGACASQYADQVIVTDDNPRTENPAAITQAILSGCHAQTMRPIQVIHDRALAIQTAIRQSEPGDCILIAGKGHETFQEIGTRKIPFSDAQVVSDCLTETEVVC